MQALHWLPVHERVDHKILTPIYKCTPGKAPMYLQDLLVNTTPRQDGLHSGSTMHNLLVHHVQRQTLAARLFAVYGPSLWNTFPNDIKKSPTPELFKIESKHYYTNELFISSHCNEHFYN